MKSQATIVSQWTGDLTHAIFFTKDAHEMHHFMHYSVRNILSFDIVHVDRLELI
jgi:hypothetical protein